MIYYTPPSTGPVAAAITAGLLGAITTPKQGNLLPSAALWIADNGCYGKGWPGTTEWLRWLQSQPYPRVLCGFAVAPDVVCDAAATWERSAPHLATIRSLGYKAALVAQNGLESMTVAWGEFDVLFLGGDTAWKLGPAARGLTAQAVARGVPVHMGRVNSLRRLRYATAIGCSSADGTFLTFGPRRRLPEVLRWCQDVAEPALFSVSPPPPPLEVAG